MMTLFVSLRLVVTVPKRMIDAEYKVKKRKSKKKNEEKSYKAKKSV
jgi:hypothetical protein